MFTQPLTLQYRPVDFATVVGQDHITSIIREQIAHDAARANYLFFGPRGTGKTSTARIVAKALNCLSPDHGNPCNQCANCQAITADETLDIVEIDAASHTGVDNVREEIIAKVAYQPTQLKKKVYIIDEVHMLSKGAFNALLKVMEEPPVYVTFILATTEIHKVLETIVSRCQSFQFHRVSRDAVAQRLQRIADAEGIKTDSDALMTIAKVSEGIMRDAVKYLDQVSVLGDVTGDRVQQFLGMVDDEQIAQLLSVIQAGDVASAIQQVTQLQSTGVDVAQFAKQVLAYVDERFLDDVNHMAQMAALFGKILGEMKYYPYPLLVYKRYLGELGLSTSPAIQSAPVQVVPVTTPAVTQTTSPVEEDIAIPEPTPTQEKSKPVEEQATPVPQVTETPTPEVSDPVETTTSTDPVDSTDTDAIKTQLVSRIDAKMLKSLVEKYVMVDAVDGNLVKLIIINKAVEISLKKEANQQTIKDVLSVVLGRSVSFAVESMTKEEYAMKLLG